MDAIAFAKWRKLNAKQRSFIEAFVGPAHGNATEAARLVGYRHPRDVAVEMMANEDIVAILKQRIDWKEGTAIQDEVTKFWSDTMRNPDVKMPDRLKATEYLAKFTFAGPQSAAQQAMPANMIEMAKALVIAISKNKPLPALQLVQGDEGKSSQSADDVVDSAIDDGGPDSE